MILVVGIPEDPPLASVCTALEEAGAHYLLVDQGEIGRFDVELNIADVVTGEIRYDGVSFPLEAVRSIYLRPYDPDSVTTQAHAAGAWTVEQALSLFTDVSDIIAINRPSTMASNASKPYQLAMIQAHGFSVPETILSSDPESVREFWRRHGSIIYKSMSGIRSIVSQLHADRAASLHDVARCPTQFQRYIPGTEYRVHVVGHEVFACRIVSDDDDYRYGTASMVRCKLPDEIAHRCFTLTASLGLLLGGIDLRRTPEGEWYCLEVNPSPAFSCFESDTDPEIARAIAQILSHAPRPVAPSVTHHEFHPAPVENHREDRHPIAH